MSCNIPKTEKKRVVIVGGGFGGFGGSYGSSRNQTRARKGADSLYGMKIDFMDAVYGCKKDIDIEYIKK